MLLVLREAAASVLLAGHCDLANLVVAELPRQVEVLARLVALDASEADGLVGIPSLVLVAVLGHLDSLDVVVTSVGGSLVNDAGRYTPDSN